MKIISIGVCKNLDDVNSRLAEHSGHWYKEYECTWKKPTGEEYKKYLKNKPLGLDFSPLIVGSYNSYGHKLIGIETCYLNMR